MSTYYFMFMYLHRASWHSSDTVTEGFPCFFLSCKANARVKPAKTGHCPHSSKFLCCFIFVLLYVLFVLCRSVYCVCVCVCKCVLYYCHRESTQLQLTNISYNNISYHIISLYGSRIAIVTRNTENP